MLKKPFPLSSLTLNIKITALVLLLFLCGIWVLTIIISNRLEHEMIAQIEAEQLSTAAYIADSIENQIKTRITVLNGISSKITRELMMNPVRLRKFLYDRTFLLQMFQTGVVVISKEGKGITDFPILRGRADASYTQLEYFKEVVATGKQSVGKPNIGRFSKKPVVGFAVPVVDRSGQIIAVLAGFTLLSDPTLLGTIESNKYEGFVDRILVHCPKYGIHVTGSDPTRILTPKAKPGVEPLLDRFAAGFEGSGFTVNTRGIRILLSAKQIPSAGWFVRVGLPVKMAFAPIRSMKNRTYSIALGLSLLSSLLVWLIIRQALLPLYAATRLIKDMTEERLPLQNVPVTRNDEVGQLLTSFNSHLTYRKQAEEQIRRALKEKETLLREIHHRVKNNMAVVSSLLSLQSRKIKDDTARSLFEESKQRVRSMALVHEKLYQTKDLSSINFEDYITSIVSDIISVYRLNANSITTEVHIENIALDLELAVPCGLIINELLTNAFKHAFPNNRSGVLKINFTKADDTYTLTIEDNGVGLPEGFDYKKANTLGLQIIDILSEQLGGTFQIKSNKGTEAVVTFKVKTEI